jgi:hypothetical protein
MFSVANAGAQLARLVLSHSEIAAAYSLSVLYRREFTTRGRLDGKFFLVYAFCCRLLIARKKDMSVSLLCC